MATVTLGSLGRGTALMGALLVLCLCLPAASLAAGGSSGGATMDGRSSGEVLSVGVGYGSQGGSQAVRELQVRLRTVGYEPGPIDGLFGPLTRGAVRSFQRAHGLASDGVVGPRTDAALRRAGIPAGSASVRVIQRQLHALGYETGPIDGVYGARTEAAVERFQAAEGLAVNGVPGAQTAARLKAQRAALIPEPAKRAAGPVPGATARSALGAARPERPRPDTSSGAGPSSVADPSSPVLRPGYLALLAALALVLALTGVRATRRRKRTPAPAPEPVATRREGAGFNPGLACAVLLGGLVVGAAGGALFATRASPDDGAASTAKSLLSRTGELQRPSASRSERTERHPVVRARAASAVRAPRPANQAPAISTPPASAAARQEGPVLGAESVVAARTRRAERPLSSATERDPVDADIARAPTGGWPGFRGEDKLAIGSSEAGAAWRP